MIEMNEWIFTFEHGPGHTCISQVPAWLFLVGSCSAGPKFLISATKFLDSKQVIFEKNFDFIYSQLENFFYRK